MKRLMANKFSPLIFAILIFSVLLFLPETIMLRLADFTTDDLKNVAMIEHGDKVKSLIMQTAAFENPSFLPFYGSSVVQPFSKYHASNYFPSEKNNFTPYLIYRGWRSSIINFLDFTSLGSEMKNKKVVILISPTDDGIQDNFFTDNYTQLQGYRFFFNSDLNDQLKKQASERLLSFSAIRNDPLLNNVLNGLTSGSNLDKLISYGLTPLVYTKMMILEKRDFMRALMLVKKTPEVQAREPLPNSWEEIYKEAIQDAKNSTTNNRFGILNDIYTKNLEPKIKNYKDSQAKYSVANSKEYSDLQLVVEASKELKADPVFIIVPANGYWYDYTGWKKEDRNIFYTKTKNILNKSGYTYFDYSGHEYDKYWMRDTGHIGWLAWTNIDHDLENLYESKQSSLTN